MTELEPITPEGLAELREELERLEGPERQAIAERIKSARELGDLKENAEYHDAKNSQALLEGRIAQLRERMVNSKVVEAPTGDHDTVGFGSTVEFVDVDGGRRSQMKLVGRTEARPGDGLLSIESPVAQALMGAAVGDTVAVPTPKGERRLEIVAIS
jgi:transcription elongation factor GreA